MCGRGFSVTGANVPAARTRAISLSFEDNAAGLTAGAPLAALGYFNSVAVVQRRAETPAQVRSDRRP